MGLCGWVRYIDWVEGEEEGIGFGLILDGEEGSSGLFAVVG